MRAPTLAIAALVLSAGTVGVFAAFLSLLWTPPRPAWYLGALTLAVALAVAAVWRARQWLTVGALVVTVVLLVLAAHFRFVAMRVPVGRPLVTVGQPASDFTLPDATGRPVSLADYRGKKLVVLVFYLGYW